jgi:hypothetical protein
MSTDNAILNFLRRSPASTAKAIAEGAFDKNKLSKSDLNELEQLIDNGQVVADDSGRYTLYSVASAASVSPASGAKSTGDVPAMKLEGFSAKRSGKGLVITSPDGQKFELEDDEYLLVINNKVEYTIKTPADVLSAITDFTSANGISTFTIKDLITNKEIKNHGDITLDSGRILCFRVEKHNKAA